MAEILIIMILIKILLIKDFILIVILIKILAILMNITKWELMDRENQSIIMGFQ